MGFRWHFGWFCPPKNPKFAENGRSRGSEKFSGTARWSMCKTWNLQDLLKFHWPDLDQVQSRTPPQLQTLKQKPVWSVLAQSCWLEKKCWLTGHHNQLKKPLPPPRKVHFLEVLVFNFDIFCPKICFFGGRLWVQDGVETHTHFWWSLVSPPNYIYLTKGPEIPGGLNLVARSQERGLKCLANAQEVGINWAQGAHLHGLPSEAAFIIAWSVL